MTLGIARPVVRPLPVSLPVRATPDPRMTGEDPARIRATIARAPLFAALPITAIEDLTARVTVRKVAVGSAVVAQDEPGDAMFVIMTGRVKVVIFGESGREVTLSLLRAGDRSARCRCSIRRRARRTASRSSRPRCSCCRAKT